MSDFFPHVERLCAVAASPLSTKLLFGGYRDAEVPSSELQVLRLPQLEALAPVALPSALTSLLWLNEERAIAGTKSGSLVLLDLRADARILAVHDAGGAAITAMAVDPAGRSLAAVSDEGTLRLWSLNADEITPLATRAFARGDFEPSLLTHAANGSHAAATPASHTSFGPPRRRATLATSMWMSASAPCYSPAKVESSSAVPTGRSG